MGLVVVAAAMLTAGHSPYDNSVSLYAIGGAVHFPDYAPCKNQQTNDRDK